MNKENIISELTKLKPYLAEKYYISEIGLFGSFARGDNDENSDIDLLVEYSKTLSYFKIFDAIFLLEKLFNKKIDFAEKKNLKEFMKDRILSEVIYI